MGATLREVIRETTSRHLDDGHLVMGQCLSAVGFVANTLPNDKRLTEFPMSDVAQSGFVVGAALVGRRPIYVVRYQGFQHFNAPFILNYAAKSTALWGRPCPLLVRSIAMEGRIGPTSGSSHHSLFTRMPGVKVLAPMTPGEWRAAYEEFMEGDDPVYLSEHRKAYDEEFEFIPSLVWKGRTDVAIFPISITRKAAADASVDLFWNDGINVSVHHVNRIKPFAPSAEALDDLARARCGGIVLDDDYPDGTAKALALDLHELTGARMRAFGLEDRTAGFAERFDNLPPDKEKIKTLVKRCIS